MLQVLIFNISRFCLTVDNLRYGQVLLYSKRCSKLLTINVLLLNVKYGFKIISVDAYNVKDYEM